MYHCPSTQMGRLWTQHPPVIKEITETDEPFTEVTFPDQEVILPTREDARIPHSPFPRLCELL